MCFSKNRKNYPEASLLSLNWSQPNVETMYFFFYRWRGCMSIISTKKWFGKKNKNLCSMNLSRKAQICEWWVINLRYEKFTGFDMSKVYAGHPDYFRINGSATYFCNNYVFGSRFVYNPHINKAAKVHLFDFHPFNACNFLSCHFLWENEKPCEIYWIRNSDKSCVRHFQTTILPNKNEVDIDGMSISSRNVKWKEHVKSLAILAAKA